MTIRNLILAALCAMLTTPAFGGVPLLPPAKYDYPYPGRLEVMRVHPDRIHGLCKPFFRGRRLTRNIQECAIVDDGVCLVIMPDRPIPGVPNPEHLFRHGQAHCNDWIHG